MTLAVEMILEKAPYVYHGEGVYRVRINLTVNGQRYASVTEPWEGTPMISDFDRIVDRAKNELLRLYEKSSTEPPNHESIEEEA